ncbi:flavin-containing monooxygenase [Rhodococcoides corynebacterioides]|uniref:flavin-containing monooxygenase n=1 Tax=Rhodococcoides corynebacterioides TaxID=53972 RepID=UPI001C9A7921|nr:NAD(P)/FAD-dependent oxidoreductase [Rhodococcus corynebacterioides]MBY6361632.1 NAD(P)/FAD-dependent oxidoreductase [Rhodococcus corynebacterioides]
MTVENPPLVAREIDRTPVVDVVVIGAGLSGVGAACQLTRERPGSTYVLLEARDASGGTWDLFRYPGVRSDSDMYTLGYSFRPWSDPRTIADGPSILRYVRDTAAAYGVEEHIRYGHRAQSASWDSVTGLWTVRATTTGPTGSETTVSFRCRWLSVCTGYYRYDRAHRPTFADEDVFTGRIVSPQHWPADLDWTGSRVTVVGSGATAVTLVPTLAADAAHVTMLQRTPTYIVSLPGTDPLATLLHRLPLPDKAVSRIMFWKNVVGNVLSFEVAQRWPALAKWTIRRDLEKQLGGHLDVDEHFSPPYDPWDQRVCVVPDGDLFTAIREKRASVVTDTIERFVPDGILTTSGRVIETDIVVAATGLEMMPWGGLDVTVDGRPVSLPDSAVYKGMLVSGVPNLNFVMGYTNNSWTLKADLVSRTVARLLVHFDTHGVDRVVPRAPADLRRRPFVDLRSGYVRRGIAAFPHQGDRAPWRLHQNYLRDIGVFRRGFAADPALHFGSGPTSITPTTTHALAEETHV